MATILSGVLDSEREFDCSEHESDSDYGYCPECKTETVFFVAHNPFSINKWLSEQVGERVVIVYDNDCLFIKSI